MHDRVFIVAEAGVNHNGSLDLALKLVEGAARAKADAVKFQTFRAESVASVVARKADYQLEKTGAGGQLEMLRALELSISDHYTIAARCKELGIAFMSTAFDVASLRFLATFDMPAIKIPSGDLTAAPLLLEAARLKRPLIVSTGMSTLDEIRDALGVIAYAFAGTQAKPGRAAFAAAYESAEAGRTLSPNVTLLHCVTQYPAPLEDVNLRAMDVLRSTFDLPVGYSDHTLGTSAALAAVARGATVIEKHFTVDRRLPGPDHSASIEVAELTQLVSAIREIELVLGAPRKEPAQSELGNRALARRSLVAARAIRCGELFTEENMTLKRPGTGAAPVHYWELLGRPAGRNYAADELIDL